MLDPGVSSAARRPSGPAPDVRGSCPSVLAPMAAADGLLVRIRLPGGYITGPAMRVVAEIAERFGNGVVELTSRANLQIRGLAPHDVDTAAARLQRHGLARPEPEHDGRRDVVASPMTGHDPRQLVDVASLTLEAADLLSRSPDLDRLPPKFGVVIDDGGSAPVRRIASDLTFGARRAPAGDVVFQVELGRALEEADSTVACIASDAVLAVVASSARYCARTATRLGELVAGRGRDALLDELAGGSDLQRLAATDGVPEHTPLGLLPHRISGLVNVGAAPLLGRTSPEQLVAVARLAEVTSSTIRLTPWRGVLLLGVEESRGQLAVDHFAAAGFSSDPHDPAHRISACTGSPGCASSRADTMSAARALLASTPTTATRATAAGVRVHLSGCEKRCGANAGSVLVADEHGAFGEGA